MNSVKYSELIVGGKPA